jgi:hypothetical protein
MSDSSSVKPIPENPPAETHRSLWNRENTREWIVGLLLPLVIFGYTWRRDKADDEQRNLDRVTAIIKSLGSSSDAERGLARGYVKYLIEQKEAPEELASILVANANSAATRNEAESATSILQLLAEKSPETQPAIKQAVSNSPTRVFIEANTNDDLSMAREIQSNLITAGYSVPPIEKVGPVLKQTDVRYFNPGDAALAQQLAELLNKQYENIDAHPKDASKFAGPNGIPNKQLELWLKTGADIKAKPGS